MRRHRHFARSTVAATAALLALCLTACDSPPPSWERLITAKIQEQLPQATVRVEKPGWLRVEIPGQPPRQVETEAIAMLCRRGPRECDHAIDEQLLALQPKAP